MENLLPTPDSTTNMERSQKHSYSHTDIHHHKSYSPDVEKPFDLSVSKCYSSFAGVEKNPSALKFYEPSTELPSSVEAFPIDYSVRKRTREDEDFELSQLTKRKKRETTECVVRSDYLACFPAQSFSDELNSENKTRPAEGELNNDSDIEIISWIRKDFNREDEKIDSFDGGLRKRKIHCKDLGQLQNIQRYSECYSDREIQLIMTNNLESEPPELIPINEIPRQFQEPESACRRIPASDCDCEFSCDCCGGSEYMNKGTPHSCGNSLSSSSSPAPLHSLLHAHRILMQKREKYLKSLEKARTINIEPRYSNCSSTVNTYCLCDGQIEIHPPSSSVTPYYDCCIFPDKTKTDHID